ncbi:MAG: hypothetical protein WAL35_05050 [Acidimicrobiales bacterium]
MTRPDAEPDELAARLLELSADDLLNVVGRAEEIWRHRAVDPALRAAVLQAIERAVGAGRLPAARANLVRAELDHSTPAAVLEAHADALIEDRPTIGAFPRVREGVEPPNLDDWLREDPRRLGRIVDEAARFRFDLKAVAAEVLALADTLGVDEALADQIVADALRSVAGRNGGRRVG